MSTAIERLQAELRHANDCWTQLANDVLENAPAHFDGDEAIDAIAVRYVRSLEEQLAAARTNPAGTMPINEFRDAGFIAAINHRLLHPVGLALGVTVHDDGTATLGPVYTTDDPEGWIYGLKDPDYAADIEQKLERVAAREAEWHPRRNAVLGFVIQPITATATEDQP